MTFPQIPDHDPDEYFGTDIRYVSLKPLQEDKDFLHYLESLPRHIHMGAATNLHTYWEWTYHPETPRTEPLAEARAIEELDLSSLPKPAVPSRYQGLSKRIQIYQNWGLAVMGVPPHLGGEIFETAWRL